VLTQVRSEQRSSPGGRLIALLAWVLRQDLGQQLFREQRRQAGPPGTRCIAQILRVPSRQVSLCPAGHAGGPHQQERPPRPWCSPRPRGAPLAYAETPAVRKLKPSPWQAADDHARRTRPHDFPHHFACPYCALWCICCKTFADLLSSAHRGMGGRGPDNGRRVSAASNRLSNPDCQCNPHAREKQISRNHENRACFPHPAQIHRCQN
jgi:hypothetical protein